MSVWDNAVWDATVWDESVWEGISLEPPERRDVRPEAQRRVSRRELQLPPRPAE